MSTASVGRIKLYTGCMFASKSSTMLRDLEKFALGGKKCMVVRHSSDDRYKHLETTGIVCHNMVEYKVTVFGAAMLGAVDVTAWDVIGVSEAQFFSDLLIVDTWANAGKIVVVEGLDGDFNRGNFGGSSRIPDLIAMCEKHVKLHAVCVSCGESASFTKKISGDMSAIHDIGGHDKYLPVCRRCYNI